MTGEKKSSVLSAHLGVKRSKPTPAKSFKSPFSSINPPPKAATAPSQPKKDEIQRRKTPFNDMILHRSTKDKDATSNAALKREDAKEEVTERGRSEDGWNGECAHDAISADRIAELERVLAVARGEQDQMKEELAKLREDGLMYREKIEEYRQQLVETYHQAYSPPGAFHSRPTSRRSNLTAIDSDPEVESRRRFSHREDLIEQNYDLRSKIAQLQDEFSSQDALHQSRLEQTRSRSDREWNELTSRLHTTEKESQERLEQLLSLKYSISSLTRMESQVTDSDLSENFSQLANRVREWVISNFRRTKLDLGNIPSGTAKALEEISPDYIHMEASNRLALFQALVSNILMRIFCEPLIIGIPQTGAIASIRELATYMRNAGAEYHGWCRTTVRSLEKCEPDALRQERENLIHQLSSETGHQLFTLTSMNLTPHAQSAFEGILGAAVSLQRTLLLQKAVYSVRFFRHRKDQRVNFDDSRMESINDLDGGMGDDGDVIVDRTFDFCVFPCLEKFGDEYGEHSEVTNILLKARVCCGVR